MSLLFIQGGSRWKFDGEGNIYTDSNFNDNVWKRYRKLDDELVVLLRKEQKIYSKKEASEKFNKFDDSKMKYIATPDLYKPWRNAFNLAIRKEIMDTVDHAVKNSDRVVIRSLGNIYTNTALNSALKYDKPFLVEVTGFSRETLWYHSIRGKIVSIYKELQYKRLIKKANYASYVTKEALQKRYSGPKNKLGCSDVELKIDTSALEKRIHKIKNKDTEKFVLGTAAFLDVKWKGQKYVIKAIADLKNKGITGIEYQLIGSGTGKKLIRYAKKLGVENEVKVIGALPHSEVWKWYDSIDVYVQPSFSEGLCRSIVEAMSRACPIICSDVGGNYELIEKDFLFQKAKSSEISKLINLLSNNKEVLLKQAERNFKTAKDFDKEVLDRKRNTFYKEWVSNGK